MKNLEAVLRFSEMIESPRVFANNSMASSADSVLETEGAMIVTDPLFF